MKIIYRNKSITLDSKNALGSGGEANIIKYGNLAFKIYHVASPEKIKKLNEFLKSDFKLPNNIAAPIDFVLKGKDKIGFSMRIAKKAKEFKYLSNKSRLKEGITTNNVICAFHHAKQTVDILHKQGLIIGDFNDLNILYNSLFESIFIDVDSYQFKNYPCPVGAEDFLDPELFGIDLSKGIYFNKQTDWYAFAVMLFKSLLFAHPYGGVNKKMKKMLDRAKNKVTLFDSGVIYPKTALHPETLSDSLLEYFNRIFKEGKRENFDVNTLQQLEGSFINCKKCGIYYSSTRAQCPTCNKMNKHQTADISQIITTKAIDNDVCRITEIFNTTGTILFTKVIEKKIFNIVFEETSTLLYITDDIRTAKVFLWNGLLKDVKYDIFKDFLVLGNENDLMIFKIEKDVRYINEYKKNPVTKTTTMIYNDEPVFSCSDTHLYRITDTMIMKCEIIAGKLIEKVLFDALENQTWFKIGSSGLGLGFYRIFNKMEYFVFSDKGRFNLDLKPLPGHLIETEVNISINSALLLRKNLNKGRTYSHLHLIKDDGKILETRVEESLSSELLRNIKGKAFAGSNIIHATDAGIATEKHKVIKLKSQTEKYVTNESQLFLYKNGLLIVGDKRINYITLTS